MRIAITYWSGTGNTEAMASLIAEGARLTGAQVDLIPISQWDKQTFLAYDRYAFGCPASGGEELEELEFLPYYNELEKMVGHKLVALFGSYGWGGGEYMREWERRVRANGVQVFEQGLAILDEPSDDALECREFGYRFASAP
ncbi:MAG: flavodoxin [Sphaerochaetaceae bacterium]